jgi:hypothetical protein
LNNLETSISFILRPIVRFLLKNGLKYSQINDLIQRALVEESVAEIKAVSEEVSLSKIALISGVHRSKAKELLNLSNESADPKASTLSKILGYWSSNPEFIDESGLPKPLSIVGADSEFSKLVSTVTKQISPYTVLFELKRIGAIVSDEEIATFIQNQYWTGDSLEETYHLAAKNIESLLSAIEENLNKINISSPQLHLTTEYDNIEQSKIPEIKQWFLTKGEEFHKEARAFLSKFDKDLNPHIKGPTEAKVSVTTFSFAETKINIERIKPNKRGRKRKV